MESNDLFDSFQNNIVLFMCGNNSLVMCIKCSGNFFFDYCLSYNWYMISCRVSWN